MEQTNFSKGLRAFADVIDENPNVYGDTGSIDYHCLSIEKAQAILKRFPNAEVKVHQAHDLATIIVVFDGLRVEFHGSKSVLAYPTLDGNTVLWVIKPELRSDLGPF